MTKRRKPLIHVGLAVVLLVTATGVLPQPVDALRLFGRRGLVRKIFRMTPLGRVVATFEGRRDDYRAAQNWLDKSLDQANQRDAKLKVLLRKRWIDVRSYVKYRSMNEQRKAVYKELKDRMTKITRDNFNRALGQQVLDRLVPKIVRSAKFEKTIGELNDTFDSARGILTEGIQGIDKLAAKADFGFLGKAREKAQRLMKEIDKSPLAGAFADQARATLEEVDRSLGELQQNLPEMAKPEFVKQMQQQAAQAVENLQNTQNTINQEIRKVKDQGTVYIPVHSAEKDPVVQQQMKTFKSDATMTRRAIAEARVRRAVGPRLRAMQKVAMEKVGIDRADPLYNKIRGRVLEKMRETDLSTLTADELAQLWQKALEEILAEEEREEEEALPIVVMQGGYNVFPFDIDTDVVAIDPEYSDCVANCRVGYSPGAAEKSQSAKVNLVFDLETGAISGTLAGSAELLRDVTHKATFNGKVTEGRVWLAKPATPESGPSWEFEGKVQVNISAYGERTCARFEEDPETGRDERVEWTIGGSKNFVVEARMQGTIQGPEKDGGEWSGAVDIRTGSAVPTFFLMKSGPEWGLSGAMKVQWNR